MRARPMLVLACIYILAILMAVYDCLIAIPLLIALAVYVCHPFWKAKQYKKLAKGSLLLLFVLLVGLTKGHYEQAFRQREFAYLREGETLVLLGELDKKETKKNNYLYYLSNCSFRANQKWIPCNDVLLSMESDEIPNGSILQITAQVSFFESSTNDGNFDAKTHYLSQKIDFQMKNPSNVTAITAGNTWKESLYQIRKIFGVRADALFDEKSASIIKAMLLGDRGSIEEAMSSLYQVAGISHILSISGLHISMLGMGVYTILRKLTLPPWMASLPAIVIVISYVYLSGCRVSSLRACMMFFLVLGTKVFGDAYDLLNGLSLVVLLLLFENPFYLTNTGYLFSVFAVFGVSQIPQDNKNPLLASLYIQFSTFPLVACFYYEISIYGIIANIVVLPFLPFCFAVALLSLLLNLPFLAWICSGVLFVFELVCLLISKLPFASIITGTMSWQMIILYFLLLFFGIYIPKKKRYWIFGVLLFLVIFPKTIKPQITFLDVGQGDAVFIQTTEGDSLFIDGGSMGEKMVGANRILPFLKYNGVREIAVWFVSHADTDHISGLEEILSSDYPVGLLIFSKESVDTEAGRHLISLAKSKGTAVRFMKEGDSLKWKTTSITCLSAGGYSDINSNSLVLLYKNNKHTIFLGGDISKEVESELLEKYPSLSATLYKASHHGSKSSNGQLFLEQLAPKYSVISCGENNSYGHPHKEVLELLDEVESEVYITSKEGQIRFWLD